MGKKGRKTRWRKLPIPIGEGGEKDEVQDVPVHNHKPATNVSSPSFNNDEYTKITAPRQDMLFKKGSFVKKKSTPNPPQDTAETQSAGSMESDQYACEEAAPQYPYNGYVDPNGGVYYMNNSYEMYDPYYGNVTVVVGPPPQFGPGPHPVLAAVPCQPVPLQPLEWFNPAAPQPPYCLPMYPSKKKKGSVDSQQSCSRQSSESTLPPGSPQEFIESPEQSGMYMQQGYMYPGYMFGAPVYNVNGVTVQGMVLPPAPQPADQSKRRKKRKRWMRGAMADEGSESSYEEVLSCEAGGGSQSGASSDTAPGSSSSKTTSDSGVTTDLLANSGSNSPQPTSDPPMTPDHFTALPDADPHVIIQTLIPYETHLDTNATDSTDGQEPTQAPFQTDDDKPTDDPKDEPTPVCDAVHIESHFEELIPPAESSGLDCHQPSEEPEDAKVNFETVESSPVKEKDEIPTEHFSEVFKDICPEEESENPSLKSVCNELEAMRISEECNATDETKEELTKNDDAIDNLNTKIDAIIENLIVKKDSFVENTGLAKTDNVIPLEMTSINEVEDVTHNLSNKNIIPKETSPERPITDAVTKWLQNNGTSALSSPDDSAYEDEEIEEGEELTGQKNGKGNPFLAPSPSGTRTRVAEDVGGFVSSGGIWNENRVTAMCDPKTSVNKYYRLAAEVPLDKSPCLMKTAVHIGSSGPFPYGVCCIIQ